MSQLRETLRTDFGLQRTDVKNSLIVPDALRADIERLETCRIESATRRDLDLLWSVIQSLRLNSKRAKVVINTKALAHVLTELVVPIDRRYTGAFLFRFASEFDDDTTEMLLFYTAYSAFRRIAQRINLQEYVSISPSASDWNTTRPKIIDNAIIGFVEYARANLSPPQGMT